MSMNKLFDFLLHDIMYTQFSKCTCHKMGDTISGVICKMQEDIFAFHNFIRVYGKLVNLV